MRAKKVVVQWAIRVAAAISVLVGVANRAVSCLAALLCALAMGLSSFLLMILSESVSPHKVSLE